ncbi:unnamed protein product [Adineta steineri]|uniref:BAH domain-containing protein n=1 Tax=Adineta steineri TaxID=433720 RepID=A0A818II27_9BILA|nr:unnamed protein product [Adineta steineri]CAF3521700.1 unnamed protein product [Adineta steineri]
MKGVNSSFYSSSSLLNIMIPQFHQLLPIETPLSGNWLNTNYSSELSTTTNKLLSPPNSITPSSICTDLSESDYQPIDLTHSRKYSLSSPPLSNIKSESIDSIDSNMVASHYEQKFKEKSKFSFQTTTTTTRQYSNFSIEHILSSQSPTYEFLSIRYNRISSIFSKKKTKHYSDHNLHQIIHRKKRHRSSNKSYLSQYFNQPQEILIRYILDFYNDLINQQNQIKKPKNFFTIDPLKQLAEIACKLDTRHKKSLLNENMLTIENYDSLLKQCHLLIKQIYQKYQRKTITKRLYHNSKLTFKNRLLQCSLSILNILQMKKNILLYKSNRTHCHMLLSDIKRKDTKEKMIKSICFHLKSDQISSNLEILLPNNGLIYEATIQPIGDINDLLVVRLHRERQAYLIPIHDLCRLACPKMIPDNVNILSKGLRVCAYWSTSLRGLHPAIIDKIPTEMNESSMVGLIFDDGDTGLIKLDEIRLLPDGYDVKGINLDEWRVSSFQIPSSPSTSRRTCRRVSSNSSSNTTGSIKKVKKEKISSIIIPQWTLNPRNSTIRRHDNKETLHIGDCVILHGVDKSLSYIGKVLKFYYSKTLQQDLVKIQWYYSPQETPVGPHENDLSGALYESTHIDENPISTVRSKGTIYESYDDYVKKTDYGKNRKETDFYLVGHYNLKSGELQRYDNKLE